MADEKNSGRPWEARLNEAGARFEAELQRVVRYLDNEVVPEVRKQSSKGLRTAAEQLQKLAEQMDDRKPSDDEKPH